MERGFPQSKTRRWWVEMVWRFTAVWMKKLVQEKPQRRKASADNFVGHAPVILRKMRMLAFFLNTVKWFWHSTCFSGPRFTSLLQRNSREGLREQRSQEQVSRCGPGTQLCGIPVRPNVGESVYETLLVCQASCLNVFNLSCITPVGAKCVILGLSKEDTCMFFFALSEICAHKGQLKKNQSPKCVWGGQTELSHPPSLVQFQCV